jgi:hypothetical protein
MFYWGFTSIPQYAALLTGSRARSMLSEIAVCCAANLTTMLSIQVAAIRYYL